MVFSRNVCERILYVDEEILNSNVDVITADRRPVIAIIPAVIAGVVSRITIVSVGHSVALVAHVAHVVHVAHIVHVVSATTTTIIIAAAVAASICL